ncbi:hypothetical protein SAMN05421505_10912 [Sinosporangium album]|uniref:Uncharacterized protein n=1 Tax=Sinosporangium album TaxID=504805 RepID=A0A1G7XWQ1_9ACTN|nr:hypothetical protein SAMN05421505_10912 [Sinosporangium album]
MQALSDAALCHSVGRRRHVMSDPVARFPLQLLRAIPVFRTNKMRCATWRSSSRLRPEWRIRCRCLGSSDLKTARDSPLTSHGFSRATYRSSLWIPREIKPQRRSFCRG